MRASLPAIRHSGAYDAAANPESIATIGVWIPGLRHVRIPE